MTAIQLLNEVKQQNNIVDIYFHGSEEYRRGKEFIIKLLEKLLETNK